MAWAAPVIQGLTYLTNAVAFYNFIMEEGIQSGIMGCYLAKQQGMLFHALKIVEQMENHTIPQLERFNSIWGHMAFWCKIPFDDFAKAARMSCKIYRAIM